MLRLTMKVSSVLCLVALAAYSTASPSAARCPPLLKKRLHASCRAAIGHGALNEVNFPPFLSIL